MTKAFLRKEFLARRMLLSEAEQQQKIEKITKYFAEIKFFKAAFTLSYKALAAKNEIASASVEKIILSQYPECRLCYPKTNVIDNSMEAIEFTEANIMTANKWGILEPVGGTVIHPQQIDVILVPLLCFDKQGYRVGYGKGFYDRYIVRCRPDVITIGLSFFEPIETIADADEYDVPLKFCVTPEKLYRF